MTTTFEPSDLPTAVPIGATSAEQVAAFDGLCAHVAIVDRDGTVRTVNEPWRSFARSNGCADSAYGVGSNYIGVCRAATGEHAGDANEVADGIEAVLEGDCVVFRMEYPCHSPTEQRWFECVVSRTELDGRAAAVVMHVNVTERHQAVEAIVAAREAAEELSESKARFLAKMSHELRTPLNAIIGFSEMMEAGVFGPIENERYADYVTYIHASAEHLLGVLADIIEFAKADERAANQNDMPISMTKTLEDCQAYCGPDLRRKDIDLAVAIAPDAECLRVDSRAIHQILTNLLSNAIKASPEHDAVEIAAYLSHDGAPMIAVRDSGTGVATEDREKIFEPFATIPYGGDETVGGVGLGLAISRSLAQTMRGRIDVRDRPDGGAEFRLVLPPRCAGKRLPVPEAPRIPGKAAMAG